jgi:hypothetical protein
MKAVLIAVLLVSSSVMATPVAESYNQDLGIYQYVEEIKTPKNFEVKLGKIEIPRAEMGTEEIGVIFDSIVNLGKKVWAIVESNKPVVSVSYLYANALPKGVRSSEELDSFSPLQATSYRVYGENLYGMTVYDLTYSLVHRYGGSYQGRGKYLENVSVVPTALDVMWGYTVDYKVDKVSVVNTGTRENPVGSVLLETLFKVSTVVKSSESHSVYEFRGDNAKVFTVQR